MGCPYYTFRQNDYYCEKKQDYVNSDVYYRYCRDYSYDECPIYKGNSSSSGCFLTSACMIAKGLPDDCKELTVLRDFRDNWLKQQPGGIEDIAEYYMVAPKIVERINAESNALDTWNELYETLVVPCVEMIQQEKMVEAYQLYKKTVINIAK